MKNDRKKCGAMCKGCPFEGEERVDGRTLNDRVKIAIVGDRPDKHSVMDGQVFGGWSGRMIQFALKEEGFIKEDVYLTYAVACEGKGASKEDVEEARKRCLPGLKNEIKGLSDLVVVGAMGFLSKRDFGIDEDIKKVRGYLFDLKVGKKTVSVMPTFSPEYLVRGNASEGDIWRDDVEKLCRVGKGKRKKFSADVKIVEGVWNVVEALGKIKAGQEVAADIETTGFDPDSCEVKCIGFATSAEDAIVIPLMRKGKQLYSGTDFKKVWGAIERVILEGKPFWHNAYFDTFFLEWKGIKGAKDSLVDDTIILHHGINSEVYHNLAFVSSIYSDMPYWKDMKFDADDEARGESKIDDDRLFEYNGLDCIGTWIIRDRMIPDAKKLGTYSMYRDENVKMVGPAVEMKLNGMPCKESLVKDMRKELVSEIKQDEAVVKDIARLPDFFAFSKANWVRGVLYGEWDTEYWKKAISEYEMKVEKGARMDTKVFKELEEKYIVRSQCKTLRLPNGFKPPLTDKGYSSLDKLAMDTVVRACTDRIMTIDALKRDREKKLEERAELEKTIEFAKCVGRIVGNQHTIANFLGVRIWDDGRVRGNLNLTGTAGGRFSSSQPNMQNIPKKVKKIFECKDGYSFIEMDYKNIEVYVMAYVSGCKNLMEAHKQGKNVHTVNTLLWGVKEDHPKWDVYRRCAKVGLFGLAYCASVDSLYRQIRESEPDLPVSYEEFSGWFHRFSQENWEIFQWQNDVIREAKETGIAKNVFGRVRILHGNDENKRGREAVNHEIQSTAWDIIKRGMLRFYQVKKAGWEMVLNVHDSLVVVCPDKDVKKCVAVMQKCLEEPVEIKGQSVVFKVECKVGKNYGLLEEYEV